MEKQLTNRQKRALQTRQKIVDAAHKVIAEKGFENVSVDDIAKQAGVATGSFYTYFKKKEDVIDAIGKTDFYRLAAVVGEMEDKDITARLEYYSREFLATIEQSSLEVCRQWIRNNLAAAKMEILAEETTKYDFDYRAMCTVLSEAVSRGELREETPVEELALFFNAQLYGLMVAWCMSDGAVVGSEKAAALAQSVFKAALEPYRINNAGKSNGICKDE